MMIVNKGGLMTPALKEAIKEVVRLAVFAVLASAITWATGQEGEFWVAIVTVLRFLDKWIHENESKFNGLLPF